MINFNSPPKEALEYFENKGLKLTYNYQEMMHQAHDRAFTVAKITRADLLNDIHESLSEAMRNGTTFKQWQERIKPTLQKKGWWGEKEIVDPKTGEVKTVHIGSRRLKTIFNTNMRVSYQKGRAKQMKGFKRAVYWRYVSALLENTRDTHSQKHGIIKHRDDTWWSINYPPNGWGCKCTATAHTKAEIELEGWKIDESEQENIASPDWAYDVASTDKLASISKMNLDKSLDKLPTIVKNSKYEGLDYEQIKKKFYGDLGIEPRTVYIDKIGDPTLIDDSLFTSGGFYKLTKKNRHLYVEEFAKLISDPDEIYLEKERLRNPDDKYISKDSRVVKKYMRYYKDEKGNKRAMVALFEYMKDKTQGVSLYFVDSVPAVEKKRIEKLIYQKEELK